MIGILCDLLREQTFTGTPGIGDQKIDQGNKTRQIVVHRNDNDRLNTLDNNDGSLVFTGVDFDCRAETAAKSAQTADELIAFLESCDDELMNTRILRSAIVENISDDADEPDDGSGNWEFVTTVTAQIQHSPA